MGGSSLCFISHTHSREDQSLQLLPSPPSVPERLSSGPSEVSSTMAGWRERWKPLQLLIILSLLFLTNQSELGGDVEEKLSLRGTSQEPLQTSSPSSLINKQLLLHDDKDLDAFLLRFGKQTMEDWLQSVSEISPSFRQKVLVLTGSTNSSDVKRRQENIPDPQQRVPVSRKFLYNQSCGSESEPNQETPQIYQVLDELDPVSSSRTPQRPDDPMVEFDHQQILMLEDEEVVRTAAASLYEKHPTVSSLHAVDPQQRVQRVKGQAVALSERSSLVLVGHGARDHSGEMRISGYSYQDVARIIQSSSRTSQKIQTTTVVACDVGSDRRFREALLKELHEAGVETELHLWKTTIQVTETGELLSQDVSADGPQWRSEDHTKKVVLTVDGDRQIRTRSEEEEGRRGHQVLTKETKFLRPPKRFLVYRRSWPQNPETFINPNVFEKVNQNKVDELKQTFKELEGLTWGLFHSDQPKPTKGSCKDLEFNINNYVLGKRDENTKTISWMNNDEDKNKVLKECYLIATGRDIRNIIRHFGKDGEDETTFLMVNNWIYEVDPQSLYVFPVGKKQNYDPKTVQQLKESIEVQMGKSDYPHIKEGLRKSLPNPGDPEIQCTQYFSDIFKKEKTNINSVTTEAWCTTYFVASVIAESARNFRTFPLILMALDLTDNSDQNVQQKGVDFLFHQHSMTRGGSWIDPSRRGFTGSATPEGSSKLKNKTPKTKEELMTDLVKVISKESIIFTNWQNSIKGSHNYETYVEEMVKIGERYKIFQNQNEKDVFKNACKEFLHEINNKKANDMSNQ